MVGRLLPRLGRRQDHRAGPAFAVARDQPPFFFPVARAHCLFFFFPLPSASSLSFYGRLEKVRAPSGSAASRRRCSFLRRRKTAVFLFSLQRPRTGRLFFLGCGVDGACREQHFSRERSGTSFFLRNHRGAFVSTKDLFLFSRSRRGRDCAGRRAFFAQHTEHLGDA